MGGATGGRSFWGRLADDFRSTRTTVRAGSAIHKLLRQRKSAEGELNNAYVALGVAAEGVLSPADGRTPGEVAACRDRQNAAKTDLSAKEAALKSARDELAVETARHNAAVTALDAEHRRLAQLAADARRQVESIRKEIQSARKQIENCRAQLSKPATPAGPVVPVVPEATIRANMAQAEQQAQAAEARLREAEAQLSAAQSAADANGAALRRAKAESDAAQLRYKGMVRSAESALSQSADAERSATAALTAAHGQLGVAVFGASDRPAELSGCVETVQRLVGSIAAIDNQVSALRQELAGARGGTVRFCLKSAAALTVIVAMTWLTSWTIGAIRGRSGVTPATGPAASPSANAGEPARADQLGGPDPVAEYASRPTVLKPAKPVESGTPAIDIQPLPELRITAPASAMDRPRQFKVTKLSATSQRELGVKLKKANAAVLTAVDINAGMGPDDRFHKEVSFAFNLKELGLKPEHYAHVRLLRTDERGNFVLMDAQHQGDTLVAPVRHNALITVVLLIAGGAPLAQYLVNQYQKHGFASYNNFEIPHFSIHVSKAAPMKDLNRLQKLIDETEDLWKQTEVQISPEDTPQEDIQATRAMDFLLKPRVREIKAELARAGTVQWYKDEVWSPEVTRVVEALEHAYQYLVEMRKFRPPGYVIDIYLLTPWPYDITVLGYTRDLMWTYPYMEFPVDVMVAKPKAGRRLVKSAAAAPQSSLNDEFNMTACHELFHVIQKSYYGTSKYVLDPKYAVGWADSNLWFMEATACVLETEVQEDYKRLGWNSGDVDLTMNPNDAWGEPKRGYFRQALADPGGAPSTQDHGYGNAFFLLALRDRYFGRDKLAFLPALMEDFNCFMGGPVFSLWRVTSGSNKILGMDFLVFAAQNADKIEAQSPPAKLPTRALTSAEPYYLWQLGGTPLGSPCLRVALAGLDADAAKKGKLVIRSQGLIDDGVHTRIRVGDSPDTWGMVPRRPFVVPLIGAGNRGEMPELIQKGFALQRVETYDEVPADLATGIGMGTSNPNGTDMFLLLPAAKAPKAEKKDNSLNIEWEHSALYQALERGGHRWRPYFPIKEYQVSVQMPLSMKPETFRTADPKLTVDLSKMSYAPDPEAIKRVREAIANHPEAKGKGLKLNDQTISDVLDMGYLATLSGQAAKIRVWVQEVIKGEPEILGPESPVAEVSVGETKVDNIAGVWEGTTPFTDVKFRLTITMGGPGIQGVQEQVGERQKIEFDGTWDAALPGWSLDLYPEGRTRPDGQKTCTMKMGDLRPLPDGKLNLSFPPVTLTKVK